MLVATDSTKANNTADICNCSCPESELFIYPDEKYIDRGVIYVKSVPNRNILLDIPEASSIIEFIEYTEDRITTVVQTNAAGEVEVPIKYVISNQTLSGKEDIFELIDNLGSVHVKGYYQTKSDAGSHIYDGKSWQLFNDYFFNIKDNWLNVVTEYKDPQKCPGAKANPCYSSSLVTDGIMTNFISSVLRQDFYDNFSCSKYQERLLSWFYNKRFNTDKRARSKVNGIEMLPYSSIGGVHRFVGIFPAGIKPEFKKTADNRTVLFLDPWWLQSGPETMTVKAEKFLSTGLPAALGLTLAVEYGGAVAIKAGVKFTTGVLRIVAIEGVTLSGFVYVSNPDMNLSEALHQVKNAATANIEFDVNIYKKDLIDLDVPNPIFYKEKVSELRHIKQSFNADEDNCATDRIFDWVKSYVDAAVKYDFSSISLFCPVSVSIDSENWQKKYIYNLLENDDLGEFMDFIFAVTDATGETSIMMIVPETDFNLEITAIEDGSFTLRVVNKKTGSYLLDSALYKDITINKGDNFNLEVIKEEDHKVLIGPGNSEVLPIVEKDVIDEDGDGSAYGSDCDDKNDKKYPNAEELCDDIDNNCDGIIDEGCSNQQGSPEGGSGGGGGGCLVNTVRNQ